MVDNNDLGRETLNEHAPRRRRDWVNLEAVHRMSYCSIGRPDSVFGIRLNPVSSLATTIILWTFIVVCLVGPKELNKDGEPVAVFLTFLNDTKSGITKVCTWLYIGTQQCWFIFILYIYFSKYGKIKLGKDDDKPEYDTGSWFMMLFAAGVGVGLLYFGVAEPIAHYKLYSKDKLEGANRHTHLVADERAQHSMNLTWYHWGVHGWIVYSIVGLTMALVGYRKGLPVTMRSCFYPLLGDKAFGPIGDAIDVLSAVCTMFGVCCSLGLGVMDVSAGITRVAGCQGILTKDACTPQGKATKCEWTTFNVCKAIDSDDDMAWFDATNKWYLVGLIWVITAIASISVVTGMKLGIRALSILCFSIGMFLWVYVFFTGKPWYFLDIFTQQMGLYIQTLMQVGTHTDSYARHSVITATEPSEAGAGIEWMDTWTMFYWGWWISWSPFVGMFIAKISKGRTIRQFINGTLTAPALYGFVWFTVFGGDGLRMERSAEAIGLNGTSSPAYLNLAGFDINKPLHTFACVQGSEGCAYYSRLSQRDKSDMWMDMISRHFRLGPVMMSVSLAALVLYFVTSADSGSLVIDALCSNGRDDPPAIQKIYWAVTQGAAATALVFVGWSDALNADGEKLGAKPVLQALQAASISSGLPYTIMMCFMCASLLKTCQYDSGDAIWCQERFFRSDLFNVFDLRLNREWAYASVRTLAAIFAPWYFLQSALIHGKFKSRNTKIGFLIMMGTMFYLFPICCIFEAAFSGALYFGIWWFLCFVTVLTCFRYHMRSLKNIDGDIIQDVFACLFMYPMVVEQLDAHFRVEGAGKLDPDEDSVRNTDCKDSSESTLSESDDDHIPV